MIDHPPRYYQPQPGYRGIEIELALEHVVLHGYAITRWEDRDGWVPVQHDVAQITPFGLVSHGAVIDPCHADQRRPNSPSPSPPILGYVKTGIVSLALIRRIAGGTIALYGREPIV